MAQTKDSLAVLWTNGDREIALNMVFMYALNAQKRGWWDEVKLIIWGPSQELASRDEEIQAGLKEMDEAGVELEACIVCAERYGVVSDLEELGVDVYGLGEPLTDYLKGEGEVITF